MTNRPHTKQDAYLAAVVASTSGEIFDLDGYAAVGADGPVREVLSLDQCRALPYGGELMYLPDRMPLVYDMKRNCVVALEENPYAPGEPIFPVAAFNSPGYVITHTSAYSERTGAQILPLFSYAAVGWHKDSFYTPVIQVDAEPRQDLRRMPRNKIVAGIKRMRACLPDNRLRAHLEKCALTYGCPAGKNFFLRRYEAPLPTSPVCNARCLGCISQQAEGKLCSSQDRIGFTPSAEEIAEVALEHIASVPRAVVSFGQGCEGEPLMVADTLTAAVARIRAATDKGTINLNTNGSLPDKIAALCDAGLDSMRVSLNSVREPCYAAYFRPRSYRFESVVAGIDAALARGLHVAVNYLNCPGFSDTPQERDALIEFLQAHPVQMIQWRNLNFDPQRYIRAMEEAAAHHPPVGMQPLLTRVRQTFPKVRFGYFNPPRETFTYR